MDTWTPLLLSHVIAACLGVLLGAHQVLRRPHGDARHRLLGRVWVALMAWTAIGSYWLRDLADGAFSWLHVLSTVTLVSLAVGIWRVRRGDIHGHRGALIGSWVGSVFAFVFAVVVPTRLLPTFAVDNPGGAMLFGLAILATSALLVFTGDRLTRARPQPRARAGVA